MFHEIFFTKTVTNIDNCTIFSDASDEDSLCTVGLYNHDGFSADATQIIHKHSSHSFGAGNKINQKH